MSALAENGFSLAQYRLRCLNGFAPQTVSELRSIRSFLEKSASTLPESPDDLIAQIDLDVAERVGIAHLDRSIAQEVDRTVVEAEGLIVEMKYARAAELLKPAAEVGHAGAIALLAGMNSMGRGTMQDFEKAYELLATAAARMSGPDANLVIAARDAAAAELPRDVVLAIQARLRSASSVSLVVN